MVKIPVWLEERTFSESDCKFITLFQESTSIKSFCEITKGLLENYAQQLAQISELDSFYKLLALLGLYGF